MMSSASSLLPTGVLSQPYDSIGNNPFGTHSESVLDVGNCDSINSVQYKKRRMSDSVEVAVSLPTLHSSEYFIRPSIDELAASELVDSGYCSRVPNVVVGRVGYGHIKLFGYTDVRGLNLDHIIKFDRHSVVVYENEIDKPEVGHGLNKAAEVTLILQLRSSGSKGLESERLITKLQKSADRQGAHFLSFNSVNSEWKFLVPHFSRFGLDEDEEDDMVVDDVDAQPAAEIKEPQVHSDGLVLSHSLPAHLGLDPVKMQEMRMLMFSVEEEDEEFDGSFPHEKRYNSKEYMKTGSPSSSAKSFNNRTPLQGSSRKTDSKVSPHTVRKAPQALLEYNINSSELSPSRNILMTGQNKGMQLRLTKIEGFKLEEKHPTPLSGGYSKNIVDAALFMGRSFRVGWGPNGVLVHSGTPVGSSRSGLSSVISVQKVAIDRAVRDENNKVKEELVDLCFSTLLDLHKSLDHEATDVDLGSCKIKLLKVVCNRITLSEICRAYIGIVEKQLEVTGLSTSSRVLLMHQVAIWELIKVLFSERETSGNSKPLIDDDGEEMLVDMKDSSVDIDIEARPFVRRAEFSYWLQDSVCHRVQEEVSCLNDSSYLEHILLLLTGRQLDAAVELAASRGDVRLSILLSQAGGSIVNRSDMAQQLDLWRMNGLDFEYIENDRLRLYELLAGNIQGALQGSSVDWKRYLGLVMWYQLPPDTSLPIIIHTYQQLLDKGRAPHPVPAYIDEGPLEEAVDWSVGDRYDIAYYLMLLHANEDKTFSPLKTMFSALSSTHDPLDYHMIWHQRAILEAIGAFSSNDLHILDMSLVSQLLCLGQCHWAIYVVIHMPYDDNFPYIQANLIKEILLQYCETWSTQEIQRQFIEDLGIPSEWMHEALAIYFQYIGDLPKALEHFLKSSDWQKAHSIFMTSVAHYLFLSSKHSEIWRITSSMEDHKSEIADWDVGAGIYIDFYVIISSLQEENIMSELDPLEKKKEACQNFFSRLNGSLLVWGSRIPVDARATYSKMSEELCNLLVSTPGESSTPSVHMSCFKTMLGAPIPEDLRCSHLQNALSVFTYLLSESET
ncbi:nuclear pore complex protein NUP96 isoform X1 [Phoenix dactylifera]|uniref:Nuclear pore complex protein NUP96 isoform X1 n=1 Tax=Phoenix dactylifera TaxID=42345 RepID=A0A8B7CKD2_PHODC|nr:nuclear pore complex protein NUP96 isoform X1 [Phoenix dactylifera]